MADGNLKSRGDDTGVLSWCEERAARWIEHGSESDRRVGSGEFFFENKAAENLIQEYFNVLVQAERDVDKTKWLAQVLRK